MVERPIKKSERLAKAAAEGESADVQPSGQREDRRPSRGKDRKGKGKGKDRKEDFKPPVNPALMRGPKPVKVVEAPPVEEPPAGEEESVEATESTESTTVEEPGADAPVEEPVGS